MGEYVGFLEIPNFNSATVIYVNSQSMFSSCAIDSLFTDVVKFFF